MALWKAEKGCFKSGKIQFETAFPVKTKKGLGKKDEAGFL
jgi:hypothetical protein